jgi:hypothetical protein
VPGARRLLTIAACLALAGCSAEKPTGPAASLTGQVIVRAIIRDESGNDLGTMDTLTVSGLQVRLLSDSVLTQSAVTSHGVFTFSRCDPGLHAAVLFVAGVPIDTTAAVHTSGAPATLADALIFGTYGPIVVYPNPSVVTVRVQFALARPDTVVVQVKTLAGAVVRQLALGALPAGVHAITWDGTTDSGTPLAPGTYCVVVDKRVVLGAGPLVARPSELLDVGPNPIPSPESGPILCAVFTRR